MIQTLFALSTSITAAAVEPTAAGDDLPDLPALGAPIALDALPLLAGGEATVPDPEGRVVVLELIRSADW